MELVNVKSSNVEAVGYEAGNLYVKYASGTYEYSGVSKELYENLLNADSKGRFMNENVRGRFKYKKIN